MIIAPREQAETDDDPQDQDYAEDLEERVWRMVQQCVVVQGTSLQKEDQEDDSSAWFWRTPYSRFETWFACTEADSKNMPRVWENCAKFVRGVVPRGPRKFVRNMCGGIKNLQRLCKICTAQFSHNFLGKLPRICLHKFCAFFGQDLNFFLRPSCTGKATLNSRCPGPPQAWATRAKGSWGIPSLACFGTGSNAFQSLMASISTGSTGASVMKRVEGEPCCRHIRTGRLFRKGMGAETWERVPQEMENVFWKCAARCLRRVGGLLPGVVSLKDAV